MHRFANGDSNEASSVNAIRLRVCATPTSLALKSEKWSLYIFRPNILQFKSYGFRH